jgi:hypothetical protein
LRRYAVSTKSATPEKRQARRWRYIGAGYRYALRPHHRYNETGFETGRDSAITRALHRMNVLRAIEE